MKPIFSILLSVTLMMLTVGCESDDPKMPDDNGQTEEPTKPNPENPEEPENPDEPTNPENPETPVSRPNLSATVVGDWVAMETGPGIGKDWVRLSLNTKRYHLITSDNVCTSTDFNPYTGSYSIGDCEVIFLDPDWDNAYTGLSFTDWSELSLTAELKSGPSTTEEKTFVRVIGSYFVSDGESISPNYGTLPAECGTVTNLVSLNPGMLSVNQSDKSINVKGNGVGYVEVVTEKGSAYIEVVSSYFREIPYDYSKGLNVWAYHGEELKFPDGFFTLYPGIERVGYSTDETTTTIGVWEVYVEYCEDVQPYVIWKILTKEHYYNNKFENNGVLDFSGIEKRGSIGWLPKDRLLLYGFYW